MALNLLKEVEKEDIKEDKLNGSIPQVIAFPSQVQIGNAIAAAMKLCKTKVDSSDSNDLKL